MEMVSFDYRVLVNIKFTGYEISRLMDLSRNHYDSSCRKASQFGGLLYGFQQRWYNLLEAAQDFDLDSIEVTLTTNDIDLLAKICEINLDEPMLFKLTIILKECGLEYNRLRGEK